MQVRQLRGSPSVVSNATISDSIQATLFQAVKKASRHMQALKGVAAIMVVSFITLALVNRVSFLKTLAAND
jgi:hypothetical protein